MHTSIFHCLDADWVALARYKKLTLFTPHTVRMKVVKLEQEEEEGKSRQTKKVSHDFFIYDT